MSESTCTCFQSAVYISLIENSPEIVGTSPCFWVSRMFGLSITGEFSIKDIYTADWKHVQVLSDMFWNKWQENYLQELQSRQKWCIEKPNIKLGEMTISFRLFFQQQYEFRDRSSVWHMFSFMINSYNCFTNQVIVTFDGLFHYTYWPVITS
jgi:hypothetical protein